MGACMRKRVVYDMSCIRFQFFVNVEALKKHFVPIFKVKIFLFLAMTFFLFLFVYMATDFTNSPYFHYFV